MSKAQPKAKAEELFNTIETLSLEERKDQLTLKRLAREAKSLASVDSVASYICQGMISFYENKPDDVRRLFDKAIKISPVNSIIAQNYAVTLNQMGFHKEHLEYADTAYKLNQDDPSHLETAIFANIVNGKFDTAYELVLRASKLRLNSDSITVRNNILQFIRSNSISPSDFVKLQDTAYNLLHSKKIFVMKPSLGISEDEDSTCLSYQILLDKPVREIVDLDVMHAQALAREPSLLEISNKVVIYFTSWCD
jgi:tetratricopeptide (TPR) repeat protein